MCFSNSSVDLSLPALFKTNTAKREELKTWKLKEGKNT